MEVLKRIELFENGVFLFRNNLFDPIIWRLLRFLLFLFESGLSIFCLIDRHEEDLNSGVDARRIYITLFYISLVCIYCLVVNLIANFQPENYTEMTYRFGRLHSRLSPFPEYKKRMTKLKLFLNVSFLSLYLFTCMIFGYTLLYDRLATTAFMWTNRVYMIFINYKFIAELLVPVAYMFVIVEFHRYVDSVISKEYEMITNSDAIGTVSAVREENSRERNHYNEEFRELDLICHNLNEACSSFQKVFKIQIFVALSVIVALFVLLAFIFIVSNEDFQYLSFSITYLSCYGASVIAMSVVGQRITYHRKSSYMKMARLNLKLIVESKSFKYVNSVMRMLHGQPQAVSCFAGIDLGLSLLPAILSISATYTIVILQFTHII